MQNIKKILVIDSDAVSVFIVKQHFLFTDLSPLWVHHNNAMDAVAWLMQNDMPDLIFLDPILPDIQPDRLFDTLHKMDIFNKTKVCLLATFYEHEFEMYGGGFNILKKFTKPFQKNQLKELLQHLQAA